MPAIQPSRAAGRSVSRMAKSVIARHQCACWSAGMPRASAQRLAAGITVIATSSEAACDTDIVIARSLNSCPSRPSMNRIGRKIATLVSIDASSAGSTSAAPSIVACPGVPALLHEAQHVALHDQRGVDDDAGREREAGQRDDVERAPEQVHRDDGEEQRDRDRRADHQQRARPAQEVPQAADGQQDADREALLDEADGATHVDARVPGQVGVELFLARAGPAFSSAMASLMPSTTSTVFESEVRCAVM